MTKSISLLLLLASLAGSAAAQSAPAHDLYLCAAFNRGYVVGSKIVTMNGVFRRDDQGGWQHIGYNDTSILTVAFDPRDRNVAYTAAINGCWRTLDGGAHWRITTSWDMTEVKDLSLDLHAPDHVYLALPDGIAVTTDRGETWQRKETGLPARGKYTQSIKVDRTLAGRVLAGCESGIYLTEDGAATWRRVLPTSTTVDDIQQSPHNPKHWVAVTQSDGAWSSEDGGRTWTKFAGVPSAEALYNIAFDATKPGRLAIGSWTHGVLTTEDGGKTWTDRNAGLPAPHRVWRVGVDPDNGQLFASVVGAALYASNDFGRTWQSHGLEESVINNFISLPKAAK